MDRSREILIDFAIVAGFVVITPLPQDLWALAVFALCGALAANWIIHWRLRKRLTSAP